MRESIKDSKMNGLEKLNTYPHKRETSVSNVDSVGDSTPPTVSVLGGSDEASSNYTMSEESLNLGRDTKGNLTEHLLTQLEEGQYFGAYSLLDENKRRPVSIYAAKILHLIEID